MLIMLMAVDSYSDRVSITCNEVHTKQAIIIQICIIFLGSKVLPITLLYKQ